MLLNTFCYLKGQVIQPNRYEMILEGSDYELVSAQEQGLFIIINNNIVLPKEISWKVIKLDTAFQEEWQREYVLPNNMILLGKHYENNTLNFLFAKNEFKDRNLELISFDLKTGAATSRVIKNYIPFSFFDFRITGNEIIVAGYYNYRPLIFLYNFIDGIPIILPGLFEDRIELMQLKGNNNETFDVLVTGRNRNKQLTIFIYTYTNFGEFVRKVELNTEKSMGLIFGRSEILEGGSQIVAGVYGRNDESTRGFFLANIDQYGEHLTKYYNYSQLKNFFNYMKSSREKRVRKRIERKEVKNKKIKFSYRLLVHDLIKQKDQFVLIGEAFYPKYKNIIGDYNGGLNSIYSVNKGLYQSNLVFDGYQYTHAVVIGFDEKGNLLWDNSFEINDVKTMELEQLVHASVSNEEIALLYVFDHNIRSKIIKKNEVIEDKELTPIALKHESDTVLDKGTTIFGLQTWYSNVFYTYGTQKIKNLRTGGVDIKREVFFINKVIYK